MKRFFAVLCVLTLTAMVFSGSAFAYKGEFVIANGAEPETLDPALSSGVLESRIQRALFENLTSLKAEDASPLPGVAKSWTISNNGKTYTFHLRKSTWSDGVPITAHDFVYSWLRILNPETAAPYAWLPGMFLEGAEEYNAGKADASAVKIKALDDNTFQFTMKGPYSYVLGALEHNSFAIVPRHVVEKYGKDWTLPGNFVGNGAFKLESWVPQEKLTVVPNPKYWDKKTVNLKRITYLPIDDDNTAHKMYLNGEVDWVDNVPLDQTEAAQLRDDYHNPLYLGTYYYVFQNEKAPFDNPKVRKALSLAFSREDITKKITKAGEVPAYSMVPVMAGYEQIEGVRGGIEQAKKYLAEAGFPNGKGFPTFTILYNTNEAHKKIAEYLQQQWKQNLGINCELENQEWKTYLATRRAGNFQVCRAGWIGDYQDPNTFLDMFLTGLSMNGGRYSNTKYDGLIKKAATMDAGKSRMTTLRNAEKLFITEDQGIMPIYHYVSDGMIDTDKWGGWFENTMNRHNPKFFYLK